MFKAILDKKRREDIKDKVEVAFAVLTIVSFAASKIQQKRKNEEATEESTAE